MAKVGRPKVTELRRIICRVWVHQLLNLSGAQTTTEFVRDHLKRPDLARKFSEYARGTYCPAGPHTPATRASMVVMCDKLVPGSARYYTSPVWDLIEGKELPAVEIENHLSALEDAQAWLFRNANDLQAPLYRTHDSADLIFNVFECLVLKKALADIRGDRDHSQTISSSYGQFRTYLDESGALGRWASSIASHADDMMNTVNETISQESLAGGGKDRTEVAHQQPKLSFVQIANGLIAALLAACIPAIDQTSQGSVIALSLTFCACLGCSLSSRIAHFRGDLLENGSMHVRKTTAAAFHPSCKP